jgi:predicted flap endonuclease-1-like 5' DNA nuclease
MIGFYPIRKNKKKGYLMTALIEIEGIGDRYAAMLKSAGVVTTDKLLETCATPKGRKSLAEASGISETLILEWTNLADLFRIKGIGEEYSDLLEEAGVDTVMELAQRNPENLLAKMTEVNEAKKLVRRMPVLTQVTDWVEQAKKLPRVIEY